MNVDSLRSDLFASASRQKSPADGDGDELPPELQKHRILPPRQTAQVLGVSPATLERMRYAKEGPPVLRLSARRIGYPIAGILAWLASREQAAA